MAKDTAPIWFVHRATEPLYLASAVRAMTGASEYDLQNWANRELIKPEATRQGKGGKRLYRKLDVCIIAVAQKLLDLGFEAAVAVDLAAGVIGELAGTVRKLASADAKIADATRVLRNAVGLVSAQRGRKEFDFRLVSTKAGSATVLIPIDITAAPVVAIPVGGIVIEVEMRALEIGAEVA